MVASVRESGQWGKHRTEVTEVTEGLGGHGGFRARIGPMGKHRTEVTEATEGACGNGGFRAMMLIPFEWFSLRKPPVNHRGAFARDLNPPSVASVASVRCFSPFAWFSPRKPRYSPKSIATNPIREGPAPVG